MIQLAISGAADSGTASDPINCRIVSFGLRAHPPSRGVGYLGNRRLAGDLSHGRVLPVWQGSNQLQIEVESEHSNQPRSFESVPKLSEHISVAKPTSMRFPSNRTLVHQGSGG